MATYKVLQDIEAEDKLIGPLTLRQFIYAGVCILNLYLCFFTATKGAPFMVVVFLPVAAVAGFFAWPWGGDQPTEIWALAKIRFHLKPRKRIWNQSGVKELVTVTVPKKINPMRTNGLSETEVKSRLYALAETIDSRGWAIKNVNVNLYGQAPLIETGNDSDRLLAMSALPQEVSSMDVRPSDDMLDVANNPVAKQFDSMIAASEKAHRDRIVNQMNQSTPPPVPQAPARPIPAPAPQQQQQPANDYWFLNQPQQQMGVVPQNAVTFNTQVVAPGASAADLPVAAANPTADEEALLKQLNAQNSVQRGGYAHLHTIQPLSAQKMPTPPHMQSAMQGTPTPTGPMPASAMPAQQQPLSTGYPQQPMPAAMPQQQPDPAVTQQHNTDILDLVTNNDLNVATIAREAQKRHELPEDEVVISLH
jgi:hypothetical protein